jgi:ABC-type uncharacterized transport system permease subunit
VPRPFAGIYAGALAGMAGATALSATTYLDQVVRARPGSDVPTKTAAKLAEAANIDVPGSKAEVANRLEGAGPLSGYAVGIGVGAVAGLLRGFTVKVPKPVAATVIGLAAMFVSDAVAVRLGTAEPRKWDAASIATDAIPHLAYGATVVTSLHRMLDPTTPQVG